MHCTSIIMDDDGINFCASLLLFGIGVTIVKMIPKFWTNARNASPRNVEVNVCNLGNSHTYMPESLRVTSITPVVEMTNVIALNYESILVPFLRSSGLRMQITRISIVNSNLECIYDKYVQGLPLDVYIEAKRRIEGSTGNLYSCLKKEEFTKKIERLQIICDEVQQILRSRVNPKITLLGRDLRSILDILNVQHPFEFCRDAHEFLYFLTEVEGGLSLKNLAKELLGINYNSERQYNCLEGARVLIKLHRKYELAWNKEIRIRRSLYETYCVAIDCEMAEGFYQGSYINLLGRVSIVNIYGDCIYNRYVQPWCYVSDYRTCISGLTKENMANGMPFVTVRETVRDILNKKIVVGHDLRQDLKVLDIDIDADRIRDTRFLPMVLNDYKCKVLDKLSLKAIAKHYLDLDIQLSSHDSIQDAAVAMKFYQKFKEEWGDE